VTIEGADWGYAIAFKRLTSRTATDCRTGVQIDKLGRIQGHGRKVTECSSADPPAGRRHAYRLISGHIIVSAHITRATDVPDPRERRRRASRRYVRVTRPTASDPQRSAGEEERECHATRRCNKMTRDGAVCSFDNRWDIDAAKHTPVIR